MFMWTLLKPFLVLTALQRSGAIRIHGGPNHFLDRPTAKFQTNATSNRNLATVNVPIPTSPDGHLVTNLPLTKAGEALPIKHWAGLLPASGDKQKYFFYWLFAPETVDENTPLLIWLNGGPACSSMDGLFLENGPIQWTVVDGKYMLQQNPHSWHKAPAYTLYIDQPVGTGLSFTTSRSYPRNDKEVNVDFYYFLTSFFNFHADKFVKDGSVSRPLYFSGESHAGHYIPSMMNFILQKNKNGGSPTIPLAGAAIGNGWMDPMVQYAAAEAAYGHGLLGLAQVSSFADKEKQCQKFLKQGNYRSSVCFGLLDNIVAQSYGGGAEYHVSQYDVRIAEKKRGARTFPKGHKVVECYLGGHSLPSWETGTMDKNIKGEVLKALHATASATAGQVYYECTDPPYNALAHQDGLGVVPDIVQVLEDESKPRLLFFNGIEDLICNHIGNEKALDNLPWHGKDKWATSKRYAWFATPEKKNVAGFMREYENLLFLKLFNSGHMVPMDLPEISLRMMHLLMHGGSFKDSEQDMFARADMPPAKCPVCPQTCPEPKKCPECPDDNTPGTVQVLNCSSEIAHAKQAVLDNAAHSDSPDSDGGGQSVSFIWAVPMIGLVFVLFAVSCWRQKREGREVVSADELQMGEYQDEPASTESSPGVI